MSKRYIVYRHIMPSGKSYIGITTHSLRERIRSGYPHNLHMRNAIAKYGWENITTEILAESVTPEEASLLETFYIEAFGTKDRSKGYNIEDGGVQRNSFSDETRRKLSAAAKKRHTPISVATRKKLSDQARKKPVRNIDTGEVFPSLAAAGKSVGHSYKHISDVCNGKRKKAFGFRWEFING